MPGQNLRMLESRFKALDRKQEKLAREGRKFTAGRKQYVISVDPDVEANPPAAFERDDVVEPERRTVRVNETIGTGEAVVRASVHRGMAAHMAHVKAHVQQFLAQQDVVASLPTANEDAALAAVIASTSPEKETDRRRASASVHGEAPKSPTGAQQIYTAGHLPANPNAFEELFVDDKTFEARQQLLAVSKLVSSTQQRTHASTVKTHDSQGASFVSPHRQSTISPTMAQSLRSSSLRNRSASQLSQSGIGAGARLPDAGPTAQASPYANPNPIKGMRPGSGKLKPEKVRPGEPIQPVFNAQRMTETFFRDLPPVVPKKNTQASLHRPAAARPLTAGAGSVRVAQARPGTAPATGPQHHGVPAKEAADVVYSKEFYYLHVKVLHQTSALSDWEFAVTISDVTYPDRILRHTFRNLRVNNNMYLVFHPPSTIILSPCDDIPWVGSPESLFQHTFRLEAFATHPVKTKVVDTVIYFGDSAPQSVPPHVGGLPPAQPNGNAAQQGGRPISPSRPRSSKARM